MLIRLQKVLSQQGVASRRRAEELIMAGRVQVNGAVVRELGTKIDPLIDALTVDHQPIDLQKTQICQAILLHKPVGVICTKSDPQGRTTIFQLLPDDYRNFYYVGRLDYNSSGALLLTNDGELANHLSHPRHHIPKTYTVMVRGIPTPAVIEQWQRGINLEGQMTLPATVTVLQSQVDRTLLKIVLREGRNRQIRKTAELLGLTVISLQRVSIGPIGLHNLPVGQFRLLTAKEITELRNRVMHIKVI
jgi:pseudouridine synthase